VILSLGTSVVVSLICMLLHYEVLRGLAASSERLGIAPRQRMLYVVIGALFGHLLEMGLFAAALLMLELISPLNVAGDLTGSALDHAVYISVESFASLGSTATFPVGPLRLFVGIESLAGLLLVGWTTAFTYVSMTEFWNQH
jgi:hypothetical protein